MNSPKANRYKNPATAGFALCCWLFSVALLVTTPITASATEPYSATYRLKADGMSVGKLERTLEQTESGALVLKTKSYVTGFLALFIKDTVNEESRFAIVDGKIIPHSYHYKKTKKSEVSEENITFDAAKKIILSSSNNGKQNFPFSGGESDKLLYQFMIRAALSKDGRVEQELNYTVIDRTQVRPYQFKVGELETLDTEIGALEVIRVTRTNEEKRKTTLWFAPSLDYLPVKIVQDAGDHNFSSTIISTSIQRKKSE